MHHLIFLLGQGCFSFPFVVVDRQSRQVCRNGGRWSNKGTSTWMSIVAVGRRQTERQRPLNYKGDAIGDVGDLGRFFPSCFARILEEEKIRFCQEGSFFSSQVWFGISPSDGKRRCEMGHRYLPQVVFNGEWWSVEENMVAGWGWILTLEHLHLSICCGLCLKQGPLHRVGFLLKFKRFMTSSKWCFLVSEQFAGLRECCKGS